MADLFETIMLFCFGLSWPINAYKNYRAGTAKNMSLAFICLIIIGYIFGTASKIIRGQFTYVFYVYLLNLVMVTLNLIIYFRNKKLDEGRA